MKANSLTTFDSARGRETGSCIRFQISPGGRAWRPNTITAADPEVRQHNS